MATRMSRKRQCLCPIALVLLLASLVSNFAVATASSSNVVVTRRDRVQHRGNRHYKDKVRGQVGRSNKRNRRHLQDTGMGKGKGGGDAEPATTSADEEEEAHAEDKATTKPHGSNIFDHTGPTMQVECGSAVNPFLTTFVTSVEFRGGVDVTLPTSAPGSKKGDSKAKSADKGKGKGNSKATDAPKSTKAPSQGMMSGGGKGKGKGGGSKYESGDGYYLDLGDVETSDVDVLPNELTTEEQKNMEALFEDVYNQLAFLNCDGFFRTVFTASMTLAPREDVAADGTYSVTLEKDFQGSPSSTPAPSPPTGQPDTINFGEPNPGTRRRRLSLITEDADQEGESDLDLRYLEELETNGTNSPNATNAHNGTRGRQSDWTGQYSETTSSTEATNTDSQTVYGGPLLTIYYVSLTATCRNCEVTPEVNFPLLKIPVDELGEATGGILTVANSSAPQEDVCTCPVGADNEEDEAFSRRELQVDDGDSLYVPHPDGPTSEEMVAAMNTAIAGNALLRQRVVGLVQLIEPDYFEGMNPPRVDSTTPAPTSYASYSPSPTALPLVSTRYPTAAPTNSREIEIISLGVRGTTTMAGALALLSFLFLY